MKKLFLCAICLASLSFTSGRKAGKTLYYFCVSRSGDMEAGATSFKRIILYNKISALDEGEADMKQKAKQWHEWVSNRCASKNPCTSDTNCYPSEEKAKSAYDNLLKHYSDTSRYILQLVDFR